MPATYNPFGMLPAQGFTTHGNELRPYSAPNGAACPAVAKGTPVGLNAGVIVSIGGGTGPMLGVALGAAWVDPATGQPQFRQYLPADTSSAGVINGDNRPQVFVCDNPATIFQIQADASVTAGDIGLNFNVTVPASGEIDTIFGVSRAGLDASTRTSAITGAVKVVGLARMEGNSFADAYPVVLVRMNSVIAQVSAG